MNKELETKIIDLNKRIQEIEERYKKLVQKLKAVNE